MTPDHASRLAARWLAASDPAPWRELEGTGVLADLTGFTRLTEALAGRGEEGVEVLHRSLTLCFSSLLDPAIAAGGDIIGFAGDAALVWFDGDGHERRAVEAAAAMPGNLGRLPAAVTGGRRIRVSIGVHTGRVTAVLAGRRQRGLFLCGPDVTTLVAMESAAAAGQVALSPPLAARLPASWLGEAVGATVLLRRRDRGRADRAWGPAPDPVDAVADVGVGVGDPTLSLLAPPVRALVTAAMPAGEHRAASIGFVSVPGLDTVLRDRGPDEICRVLDQVATLVGDVTAEHGVSWLDVDVGAGSVKLLLAAGVPEAVDDDEGRLLVCMRRIIDESDTPLRGGAQRGRVFAGALGVRSRRTFTVLGDAVNVAARALGLAADGQLVVGDGLRPAGRPNLGADPLGDVALKNRDRPVALWRVDALGVLDAVEPATTPEAATTGREAEHACLVDAWKRAGDGRGSSCLVVGEPGMGGSELVRSVADLAGGHGTVVGAHPQRRHVPYAAVDAVVASLAATAGHIGAPWAWLAAHAPSLDPDVAGWVGEAAAAVGRLPLPDGADAVTTAPRTRATVVALLEAAISRPWLLAVDGIDDIDDASRLVMHDIRRATERQPWFVVMTARPGSDSTVGASKTVVLDPLDERAARSLVLDIDPRLRDDQVDRIVRAANGNPFVLAELARNPQPGSLPDSLERLATARIDALSVPARQLVRDASAFGSTFPMALVARVLGRPELAEPRAWADASTVLVDEGDGRVRFRHDAYRLAAHRALTFQRRRELHSSIADALAADGGAGDAAIAFHLEEAGRQREAFPLAVAAARSARSAGAVVEAAELFGRGVRLAKAVERSLLPGLLADQGEALMHVLDLPGAERSFSAAARVTSDPLAYASLCACRAALESRRSRFTRARHWVRQGLTVLGPVPGREGAEVRVRLLLEDAGALYDLAKWSQSLRLATDALAAATVLGSRMMEALAHLHLELVYSGLERPEAIEHGEAAIALFDEVGHQRYLSNALLNAGLTGMLEGRWDDALDRYARSAEAGRRSGDARAAVGAAVNNGFLLLRRGDGEAADRCALEALRVCEPGGLVVWAAYARHLRSGVAAIEGRAGEAETLMAEARAAFAGVGDQGMVVDCDVTRAGHLLRAGRPADALALVDAVEPELGRVDETLRLYHLLHRGLALARTGRAAQGAAAVGAALASAATRRRYETYLCLVALVDIERRGGPAAPPGAEAQAASIAADLRIVAPPL